MFFVTSKHGTLKVFFYLKSSSIWGHGVIEHELFDVTKILL